MEDKKVLIIGAGIAGLCAGSYLQMNSYKTEIFELHSIPGGLCTAWKRKGYTFDGCIHWLVGSGPSNSYHKLWNELGALQGREFIDFEEYTRTEYEKGKYFVVYTDADKLEAEMLRIAPEDKKIIEELTEAVRKASKIDIPSDKAMELYSPIDYVKFMVKAAPFMSLIGKYGNVSLNDYAGRFKNPVLRDNFAELFGLYGSFPTSHLIMMLGWMHQKSAGYPVGGSLEFSKNIEKTYTNLGGKVNYNSMVEKILVENDKAVGIKLQNGEEHRADIVISAADGYYTIFKMLEGKYVDEKIKGYYDNLEIFQPIIQASVGVAKDFKKMPHSITFPLDKPIFIDDKFTAEKIHVRIYNFDPTLAPEGKTSITSYIDADYDYWLRLKNENPVKYRAEKERIAAEFIDALDKKIGDIRDKVEVWDIATPVTYVKYTNNWKASWEGWLPTTDSYNIRMKKTLPGIENFYIIGQWVQPGGGLPTGLSHGRDIAQILCSKDNKKFRTVV